MKKLLLSIILAYPLLTTAQVRDVTLLAPNVTQMDRSKDQLSSLPRQRVSTSIPLILTDQWQTVAFVSGNSPFDTNSFSQSRWDFTNNKIVTNTDNVFEQGYTLRSDMSLQNVTGMSKVQLRFVVPAPTPTYFPFPNSATTSFVDVTTLTIQNEVKNNTFGYDIYTNSDFRQYGCQIQLRALSYSNTSNILTGLISQVLTVLTGSNRESVLNSSLNIYAK